MKPIPWLAGAWLLIASGACLIPLSPWVVLNYAKLQAKIPVQSSIMQDGVAGPAEPSFWYAVPGMILGVLMVFLGVYLRERFYRKHRWPRFNRH